MENNTAAPAMAPPRRLSGGTDDGMNDIISVILRDGNYISDVALMFLPEIGILCGVLREVPIWMVYAVS